MIKYFCDICGQELSRQDQGRIKVRRGRVSVEVMTALDGGWNSGQICHSCIVDVLVAYIERSRDVYKLDDKDNLAVEISPKLIKTVVLPAGPGMESVSHTHIEEI